MNQTQTVTPKEAAATIISRAESVAVVRVSRRGLFLVRRVDGKTEWVSPHNVLIGTTC